VVQIQKYICLYIKSRTSIPFWAGYCSGKGSNFSGWCRAWKHLRKRFSTWHSRLEAMRAILKSYEAESISDSPTLCRMEDSHRAFHPRAPMTFNLLFAVKSVSQRATEQARRLPRNLQAKKQASQPPSPLMT